MIRLTRRYRFSASHVLAHPGLSSAENDRIYGKCANPGGHGHSYGLEVTVAGEVDPGTGRVLDPRVLDAIVQQRVLDRLSHRHLNDDPWFEERVPTAENITRAVHGEIRASLEAHSGVTLERVRLIETRRNQFEYGENA